MSIWEKREVERKLKEKREPIDTNAIINGYVNLQNLAESAVKKTRERRRESRAAEIKSKAMPKGKVVDNYSELPETLSENLEDSKKKKVKPFENLDHGAFT